MAEATYHHAAHPAPAHAHGSGPQEDWNDEDYVARWLERQQEHTAERQRQFAIVRAVIPKLPEQEFRYLNLGAGPGNLDEVLLEHFPGANAIIADSSLAMLGVARQRLARFGNRVEYVNANLSTPDWTGALAGPYDYVVSTLAIHHLGDPRRIRELYGEVYRLLGHGGTFLNLDLMRPARPSLAPLSAWAAKDPEAGLFEQGGGAALPGSLLEHLGWLGEAGFNCVDVYWKDLSTALICGIRDHLHMPAGAETPAAGAHAPHAH